MYGSFSCLVGTPDSTYRELLLAERVSLCLSTLLSLSLFPSLTHSPSLSTYPREVKFMSWKLNIPRLPSILSVNDATARFRSTLFSGSD